MNSTLSKISSEFKKKEFQNFFKSLCLFVGFFLISLYLWSFHFNYVLDMFVQSDFEFADNLFHNIIITLGLLAVQMLPIFMMLFVTDIAFRYLSRKLGWREDFLKYAIKFTKKKEDSTQ